MAIHNRVDMHMCELCWHDLDNVPGLFAIPSELASQSSPSYHLLIQDARCLPIHDTQRGHGLAYSRHPTANFMDDASQAGKEDWPHYTIVLWNLRHGGCCDSIRFHDHWVHFS